MSLIRCFGCMEEFEETNICPYCGYDQNTRVAESYYLEPGTILHAQYLVGRVLGYGGFGVTYMGYDLSLERKVAIKEYMPSDCATRAMGETQVIVNGGDARMQYEAQLKRFVEEAKKLAKFNDIDGIVDIYDCFEENNTGYIVMEFIPFPTVKQVLKEKKMLPYQEAVGTIRQILESLREVHKEGIIHRDIAPDNIFISPEGNVKLADFGAARFASSVHSRSLSIVLKPGYAPVEQYSSRGEQGPWTDTYACAATLYRMITGKKPTDSFERLQKYNEKNEDILKTPGELGVEIPKSLENTIMNALHIQKADRFQSAQDFLDALDSDRVKRTTASVVNKSKNPKWLKILVLASILILMTVGGLMVRQALVNTKQIEESVDLTAGESFLPELVGLSYEEAGEKLGDCSLVITGKRYSNSVPYDRIVEQLPEAGERIKSGSQIEIVMSGGVQEVTVPNLLSLNEDEAVREAAAFGIQLSSENILSDYSDLMEKGRVFEQSLKEGEKVDPQTVELQIVVSLGRLEDETIVLQIPDLVGKTKEEADDILLELKNSEGYTYAYGQIQHENSMDVPAGQIISQEPMAGAEARTNEVIELVISDGPKMVEVPDVVYKTQGDALSELEKAGVKGKVNTAYNSSVKKGLVISQDAEKGEKIAEGSSVTITVSGGPKPNNDGGSEANGSVQQAVPGNVDPAPAVPAAPAPAEEGTGDFEWELIN